MNYKARPYSHHGWAVYQQINEMRAKVIFVGSESECHDVVKVLMELDENIIENKFQKENVYLETYKR